MGTPAPVPDQVAQAFTSAHRPYGGAEDYTAWGRATSGPAWEFCGAVHFVGGNALAARFRREWGRVQGVKQSLGGADYPRALSAAGAPPWR